MCVGKKAAYAEVVSGVGRAVLEGMPPRTHVIGIGYAPLIGRMLALILKKHKVRKINAL